ncbi:hypothetical protein GHT06_003771 [Daphnia sinensis]|uniref:Uncharacterized protein n=1 Tax=Daphnia sinensis TaxID=1820382 RepID=A0AAD5PNH8_9CRUS|nr:hypothetical protein GHT06_003771 [Daphnia sinensis]
MNPLALFVFVAAAARAALAQSVASCYGCAVPVSCESAGTRYPVRGIARIGQRLCVCHDVGGRGTWQCLPLPDFCNRTVTQTVTAMKPTTLTQTVTSTKPTTLTQTVTTVRPTTLTQTVTTVRPTTLTQSVTQTAPNTTANCTATVAPAQCRCVQAGGNYGRWASYSVSCPATATRPVASTTMASPTTTATAVYSTGTAATSTVTATQPPVPPRPCCRVLSAECLACVANQTVAEYCAQKPATRAAWRVCGVAAINSRTPPTPSGCDTTVSSAQVVRYNGQDYGVGDRFVVHDERGAC